MESIEIIVPRVLIKKFYPHPEYGGDGDYVVDLMNGMYTDVFYQEEGDFLTITNDNELISYLKSNKKKPLEYFYRNGVYSFRNIFDFDIDLLNDWKEMSPIKVELKLSEVHNLPYSFMVGFYWIDVGKVITESDKITLYIYEEELIKNIDINVIVELVKTITNKSYTVKTV